MRSKDVVFNDQSYQELLVFLQAQVGFRLGLAQYDLPSTRDRVIEQLTGDMQSRGINIRTLDFAPTPNDKFLLTRLRSLHEDAGKDAKPQAIMVVNLEATLDYRVHLGDATERMASLTNANLQRDAFPQFCPGPMVLWLNGLAGAYFARYAPDLWHWRSGTFLFSSGQIEIERFHNRILSIPPLETDRLSGTARRERIGVLRDLLSRIEESEDRDTLGAKSRRANLLNELGATCLSLGKPLDALEYFQLGLQLCREIGDRWAEGAALGNLGNAWSDLGEVRKAIEYYEQSLAISRELGNRRGEGADLGNLGNAWVGVGEMRKAIECYEQALAISRETGDRRGEGNQIGNLGLAWNGLGEKEKAIECYEQALAISRELGDQRGEGCRLGNLGVAWSDVGQVQKAIGYYQQAIGISREVGDRSNEAITSWNLGSVYEKLGELKQALQYLQVLVDYEREIGHSDVEEHAKCVEALRAQIRA